MGGGGRGRRHRRPAALPAPPSAHALYSRRDSCRPLALPAAPTWPRTSLPLTLSASPSLRPPRAAPRRLGRSRTRSVPSPRALTCARRSILCGRAPPAVSPGRDPRGRGAGGAGRRRVRGPSGTGPQRAGPLGVGFWTESPSSAEGPRIRGSRRSPCREPEGCWPACGVGGSVSQSPEERRELVCRRHVSAAGAEEAQCTPAAPLSP